MNNDVTNGRIDVPSWDSLALMRWLPMVDTFIEKWGIEFVAPDVRQNVILLEEYFDLPKRIWSCIQEIIRDELVPLSS